MQIGMSLLLIAAGAILMWAVEIADATYGQVTIDWGVVGAILMVAGAVGLAWSLYVASTLRARRDEPVPARIDR